ncbi:EH signature domain-containing protein [Porticoccus hydrocarbonoclasticus]
MPKIPSKFDLEETYNELIRCSDHWGTLANLPLKHIKRAPWVIFSDQVEGQTPLIERGDFISHYLRVLEERRSNGATLSLASAFLMHYPIHSNHFSQLCRWLAQKVETLTNPRGKRLYSRHQSYRLFDEDGARAFGSQLFQSMSPGVLLDEAGFNGLAGGQGFARYSAGVLIALYSRQLKEGKLDQEHLDIWLRFLGESTDGEKRLRYTSLRKMIVHALLKPFIEKDPDGELKERIQEFLLKYFDDPRLSRSRWQGVDELAIEVMFRWLVRSTLQDFFRVVREGSRYDSDADRMWPYREAFWSAYLDKGVIDDAWVVLGDEIAQRAREFLRENAGAYGKLKRGDGARSTHAVLILRVGDLVISEWSHTGKYRAWMHGNQYAPRFYVSNRAYRRLELVARPEFEGSHHGAENGTWQRKLADLIAENTGIRITRMEYMPQ